MEKKLICAIILARSGSKGIKNKNITNIKGKPLLYYAAKQASLVKKIDKVFILTDSDKYLNIINKFNIKKVIGISRSKKSSTDKAQSEIAIEEFIKKYSYQLYVFIQATNIFINKKDINEAIKKYKTNHFDTLLSVIETKKFMWKITNKIIKPINYNYKRRQLRQNIENYYLENGSFYIFSKNGFLKHKNRLHGKIGYYVMNQKSYFDIDDKEQLEIVKKIF